MVNGFFYLFKSDKVFFPWHFELSSSGIIGKLNQWQRFNMVQKFRGQKKFQNEQQQNPSLKTYLI